MTQGDRQLFDADVWAPALEKFAGVTHLTVTLFDATRRIACGPIHPTPFFEAFAAARYDPGLIADCLDRCLRTAERGTVVCADAAGLSVVGTPLILNGQIVGAAVAGYHLSRFSSTIAIERLARDAQIPFARLWELACDTTPVAKARFGAQGELLQILAETILRERFRTAQYEDTADQLRATADELRATAAAKDEFLAVLSHELRTPLTPILGWAQMLKRGEDPARVARAATVIERNALLQVKLVEDLLEFTRIARGKVTFDLTTVDLGQALRAAVDVFSDPAAQQEVSVEVGEALDPVLVEADLFRLQQVFGNVLSNALKFTPPGGRVFVTLAREHGQGVVRIRDTGEGIAPEFLPFVFDIFRQQERGTRRAHEGLGIGMALVKRLTELQGGTVRVASPGQGRGTEFTLAFPALSDAAHLPPVALPTTRDVLRELHGLRILVVEDMDDTREAMRVTLERLGADVLEAEDGAEAIEIVGAFDPDVILCDLRMPRMDGYEFIRALHHSRGDESPPVIAVSGLASRSDHARTERAGFEGHIDKPFDDVGLLAAVGAVVARRRQNP